MGGSFSDKNEKDVHPDQFITVYLIGQKNSGKSTFLKVIESLYTKNGISNESKVKLIEEVKNSTKKFIHYCQNKNIKLNIESYPDTFKKIAEFFEHYDHLQIFDKFYKEAGISDGIYTFLRYRNLYSISKDDEIHLYDNSKKVFYTQNAIFKKEKVPGNSNYEKVVILYFINGNNYMNKDFFDKVNQDLKDIQSKCYLILTKIDLFSQRCFQRPIQEGFNTIYDQIRYIQNSIQNGRFPLFALNLLEPDQLNIRMLQKIHLSINNLNIQPRIYRNIINTRIVTSISYDVWKYIFEFYDISEDILSLLMVSKDMNQLVKNYLNDHYYTIYRHPGVHYNQYHHTFSFQKYVVNIQLKNFNINDIQIFSKYQSLKKIKLNSLEIDIDDYLGQKPRKTSKDRSKRFEKIYSTEETKKILLLGCGESGKSTIFKHLTKISGSDMICDKQSIFFHITLSIISHTMNLLENYFQDNPNQVKELIEEFKVLNGYKDIFERSHFQSLIQIWIHEDFRSYVFKNLKTYYDYNHGLQ